LFTGIIQDVGRVTAMERSGDLAVVTIESELVPQLSIGGSIAVNGTCLTAVSIEASKVTLEVGSESLARTSLGGLSVGTQVNLELPMKAFSLFDGHIVQGHVDGVGIIGSIESDGDSSRVRLEASPDLMRYIVEKGSITVDGISLTVASVDNTGFEVAIIPHTLAATNLGLRVVGEKVNLEVDILAKYVERLLNT